MISSTSGRCVVVDLDDTLYDEIDFVRSGYAAVAAIVRERFSFDCSGLLEQRLEERTFDRSFDAVVRAGALPAEALGIMIDAYRTHIPTIRARPDALELVSMVKRHDGVVGCITDGRSITQRNKILALGLKDVLDPVLISEETGRGKPRPHNFREMMRLVAAQSYWYVADNPAKDFVAPKALGWTTVGVGSSTGIHVTDPELYAPDHRPLHQTTLAGALSLLSE